MARDRLGLTGRTTIAAHGALSAGRVAGRSWVMSDTSNICGVEQINRTSENKHQNL